MPSTLSVRVGTYAQMGSKLERTQVVSLCRTGELISLAIVVGRSRDYVPFPQRDHPDTLWGGVRCQESDKLSRGDHMATEGKIQLLITFVADPDQIESIDSLIASHALWMKETHPREGSTALLSYNFSKGPDLVNPLDPSSEPTGNTRYVLNELYESPAGSRTIGKKRRSPGPTSQKWWT